MSHLLGFWGSRLSFVLILSCSSCAHPSADEVLFAYAAALERGDVEAARAASSSAAVDLSGWARRPNRVERLSAELSGRSVWLVLEAGEWRVRERAPATRASPIEVLDALFDELDVLCSGRKARRLDELIAAVDGAVESEVEERLRGDCERFRRVRDRVRGKTQVEVRGDRASLRYGSMLEVRWVLEQGRWRVLDLD